MDSPAQIDGRSSKPFWIVRFKNVIYKQKKFPRKLSHPKMFKNLSPDRFLAWFLHQSQLKNLAQTARTVGIAWKPQNQMKIDPNILRWIQNSTVASKNPSSASCPREKIKDVLTPSHHFFPALRNGWCRTPVVMCVCFLMAQVCALAALNNTKVHPATRL